MQAQHLVVTAVGSDRPGLVKELAAAIHAAGANLEDSRMAILGGEFALIALVTGPAAAIAAAGQALVGLEQRLGLRIVARPTERGQQARPFLLFRLDVTGVDRPGIVAAVSQVLVGHGVNVAALESRVRYAPLSGTPMFVLEAELQVPSETALGELRRSLAEACEADNLDFGLVAVR
ncbi:MAG: ACT domain-containing protein [Myxococcales bacterium]|nr:ACT domain-containing protein [Myxococcales bacterium]